MTKEIKYKIIRIFEDNEKNIYYICKKTNNHNFIKIQYSNMHKNNIIISGSQCELLKALRDVKRPLKDIENNYNNKWLTMYVQ
jgi:hypothetical protein